MSERMSSAAVKTSDFSIFNVIKISLALLFLVAAGYIGVWLADQIILLWDQTEDVGLIQFLMSHSKQDSVIKIPTGTIELPVSLPIILSVLIAGLVLSLVASILKALLELAVKLILSLVSPQEQE